MHYRSFPLLPLLCFLSASVAFAGNDESKKRAKLPALDSFPTDIFFQDAFSEGLIGKRPSSLGQPTSSSDTPETKSQAAQDLRTGTRWSSIVSAQTLEDEVKSLQIQIQKTITTPSKFSGGGYLDARRMFTELAALFSVIHEYDGQVRWKSEAAIARDLFTRAAANTKTTSIQAFNESKKRKQDLEELVRGGTLIEKSKNPENTWNLINRAALMQRFTQSYDDGIAIWTANDAEFSKQSANLKREAELLAMLADVITQDGMEDGDDEDYAAYSKQLAKAALRVLNAIEDGDAEAGRQAASAVGQACIACHEDYRG